VTDERTRANREFFGRESARLAAVCDEMAQRFLRGGRLLAVGDASDARHVAVEFVHPVIVGKRALPALALPSMAALTLEAEPDDIVVVFGTQGVMVGDEEFVPPTDDPFVRQELVETLYHVLWELVHVFIDHRERSGHGAGAAGFLYPFLGSGTQDDLAAVTEDVRRSIEACERRRPRRSPSRPPRAPAACSRSVTAGRRRTRWTSWPTSGRAGGARWTSPTTPRC
jgi:D-sedoheptulose 7-phosphate isomerase